ncbi:hypothetical protein [Proteus mirabilis]|uniref:hypothetical protein n=1 Tax=Proteus mirabilis TaxID=584 RepID=UPI000F5BFA7C|nr:hypothetical protein [Proteus mirabilis]MBS3827692.1 hypothetical protein [Proteus mirabilis]MBS3838507.1 hypothetical protein [Proteus mirabilis]MDC9789285.1 hypothetical protein [Proteus mirabilis]RQW15559.1 hypothetical protein EHQ54_10485 [Proteus mirabilis]
MISKDNWQDHYWNYLAHLEMKAIDHSFVDLKPWDSLAKDCMNLAIKAPFLKGKNSNTKPIKLSAAFLKRSMSDFRGAWLLINWGYPYQAACVAASLYENALVVNCLVERQDLADEVLNNKNADVPWGAQKLCKMAAHKDLYGNIPDEFPNNEEFNLAWKLCYHNYKLLCKMKHPTLQQVTDEASSTLNINNEFVVIPLPDTRRESLALKHMLMIICISKLFSATKCFAKAIECADDDPDHTQFYKEALEVYSNLKSRISESKIKDISIKAYGFSLT